MGPSSLCLAQKIVKNDVSYMGEKIFSIRWVVGGVGVGWWQLAAEPSPLQQAQKNCEK